MFTQDSWSGFHFPEHSKTKLSKHGVWWTSCWAITNPLHPHKTIGVDFTFPRIRKQNCQSVLLWGSSCREVTSPLCSHKIVGVVFTSPSLRQPNCKDFVVYPPLKKVLPTMEHKTYYAKDIPPKL